MCAYVCVCVCPPKAPFFYPSRVMLKCKGENFYKVKSVPLKIKSEYEALCPPGLEIWGYGRGSKESVTGGSLPKTICLSPTLSLSSWTACIPPPRWQSRPSRSSWPPPRGPPCSRAGRGSSHRRSGRGSGSGGHIKQDQIEPQSCRTSCQTHPLTAFRLLTLLTLTIYSVYIYICGAARTSRVRCLEA